jgi:hypothetical protein
MSLIISSLFYNLKDSTSSFYSRGALLFYAVLINAFASALEVLYPFPFRAQYSSFLSDLHFIRPTPDRSWKPNARSEDNQLAGRIIVQSCRSTSVSTFKTRDFMQSTLVIAGLKTKHKRLNHDFLQCLAFACHWIFEPAEELHEVEARPQRDAVEMFLAGDAGLNEGGMEVEEGRLERFEKVLDDWGGGDEVEVG